METKMDYAIEDLKKILFQNITPNNEIVFIAGNLANFGYFNSKNKKDLLDSIIESIMEASNYQSTIMTQTMSFQICNTTTPFNRYTWSNLGAFGNYLLNLNGSIRSLHPFASYTAFGKNAKICDCKIPFAYGLKSPYDNMLKYNNILMLSMGMEPNLTCSIVHHAEFNMHVPYRYIKEFTHPIQIKNEKIIYQKFYLHVLYKEYCGGGYKRNFNINFFNYFLHKYQGKIKKFPLGKNAIYLYNYKDFYNSCIEYLEQNIYAWMNEEPKIKPFIF
ncbi:AAC(3) family N-acetyltransferase [Campylobacter lari]|uniref:AAC(3) family N-acetyltransferase n=2 Tax=Campylobacter lari TaxID=201 RepID=UPI001BDB6A82|nr:AAC(3) family N-acetyltransferase [Campylobacter lari]MBT0742059.1 AAC(3) family N-acetyltransferase [Campylobacter lari]